MSFRQKYMSFYQKYAKIFCLLIKKHLMFRYLHGIFFIGRCDNSCTYLQNGKRGVTVHIMRTVTERTPL